VKAILAAVLQAEDMDMPVPVDDEVRIRVHAWQ
jgi:NADPH:quinone reductase-like Zn-dependent oxidoreductase